MSKASEVRFMGERAGTLPRAVTMSERWVTRWLRRAVMISAYFGGFVLLTPALIVLIPAAVVRDIAVRARLGMTRTLLLFYGLIACELIGVLASILIWLRYSLRVRSDGRDFLKANFELQRWWGSTLAALGQRLFRVGYVVEKPFEPASKPFLLLPRHVSFIDALFPVVFVSAPHRVMLRYVLKRELLWDPCLDIVGQRLPNCFVRRGGVDTAGDLDRVATLATGVAPDEGIVLFPEGTRFTRERRARLIAKFTSAQSLELLAQTRALAHVLPPRSNGVFAALDANPNLDVVVCAHVGLEGLFNLRALLSGDFMGREIHVAFWRIPRSQIPTDERDRFEWLQMQWKRVDTFIGATQRQNTKRGQAHA